jgi:hypothetical protein
LRTRLHKLPYLLAGGLAVLLLVAAWVLAGQRSLVDWSQQRAVVLESDDWGLCGFVPDSAAWQGIDRRVLAPGRFPAAYWNSTLEDSAQLGRLGRVLMRHRDLDGLPPVLQPNYILSALSYDQATEDSGRWRRFNLPDLPPRYGRAGLWEMVAALQEAGVWHPELHGRYHYDPQRRQRAVQDNPTARRAAARGILIFPGSSRALELDPRRGRQSLAADLDTMMSIFAGLFGRAPVSVVAPDYSWTAMSEELWQSSGLRVVQAKRQQRRPQGSDGRPLTRAVKVLARAWDRFARPDLVYLERNCDLEPSQADGWRAEAAVCLDQIEAVWRGGEPAIVETHRVNYVHLDGARAERGRRALAALLAGLLGEGSTRAGARFLVDDELAQLYRTGTSSMSRGDRLVLRNATHSWRLLPVTEAGEGEARLASRRPTGEPGPGARRELEAAGGRTIRFRLLAPGTVQACRRETRRPAAPDGPRGSPAAGGERAIDK